MRCFLQAVFSILSAVFSVLSAVFSILSAVGAATGVCNRKCGVHACEQVECASNQAGASEFVAASPATNNYCGSL